MFPDKKPDGTTSPIVDLLALGMIAAIVCETCVSCLRHLRDSVSYLTEAELYDLAVAIGFAATGHQNQMRDSGHHYLTHPLAVAEILATMRMPVEILIAAVVHDLPEDSRIGNFSIRARFGDEVARLVDGVTNVECLDFWPELLPIIRHPSLDEKKTIDEISNIKLIDHALDDAGVIAIRLADRKHNMETIKHKKDEAKQTRKAEETMGLHVLLAERLGSGWFRRELESMCFEYINPEEFRETQDVLSSARHKREKFGESTVLAIRAAMRERCLAADVSWRERSPYSVHRKKKRHERLGQPFDDCSDAILIEVVVGTIEDCYLALGGVHARWKSSDGEVRDFISNARSNGYKSLHTRVLINGCPVRVLIRTDEMRDFAEYGVFSLWRRGPGDETVARRLPFEQELRRLFDLVRQSGAVVEPGALVEAIKTEVLSGDRLEVKEPNGTPFLLPIGATIHDFAYAKGIEIGHGATWGNVDGVWIEMRHNTFALKPGQTVYVLGEVGRGPEIEWGYASSGFLSRESNRIHVRGYFATLKPEEGVALGRQLLEKVLQATQTSGDHITESDAAQMTAHDSVDALSLDLGRARIDPSDLAEFLTHRLDEDQRPQVVMFGTDGLGRQSMIDSIIVHGKYRMHKRIPMCCDSLAYGSPIIGYAGRRRGVAVHLADCRNVAAVEKPHRLVRLSWGEEQGRGIFGFGVYGDNRVGLAADVFAVLKRNGISANSISSDERQTPGKSTVEFFVECEGDQREAVERMHLVQVQLKSIEGVDSVACRLYVSHAAKRV